MKQELTIFDTETSGLDYHRHNIIQIAAMAINLEDWSTLEELEIKIQFDVSKADPDALAVNKYNEEIWKAEAISDIDALNKVDGFFRRHSTISKVSKTGKPYNVARLCAHNARFDTDFLLSWFQRYKKFCPCAIYEALDTIQLSRWYSLLQNEKPINNKLGTLCDFYGIELADQHTAMSDVKSCAALAKHLIYRQVWL